MTDDLIEKLPDSLYNILHSVIHYLETLFNWGCE